MKAIAINASPLVEEAKTEATETAMEEPMGRTLPASLWLCGILSPVIYAGTDILAARRYPGFSYTDQAVSELFAVDAPTSRLVVPLFTLSSALQLVFAFGVWSFATRRSARLLAVALVLGAIDALVLWNLFPMHMRGFPRSSTDTMHLVFAANPFGLLSLIFAAVAVGKWFRAYTIVTAGLVVGLAVFGFSYAPAIAANAPTPWMGLTERIAQYAYGAWLAMLAIELRTRVASGAAGPRAFGAKSEA